MADTSGETGPLASSTSIRALGPIPGVEYLDSVAVDSEGVVCVGALKQGGISCFHPDGRYWFIKAPDDFITNVCFGGEDMRDVWITAGATGKLFKGRWPDPGLPIPYYA